MCGIAGIVNFDGAPVDAATLSRMTDSLAHRGPDGRGTWIKGNVGFGHRRLAIRDLSDAGKQPMFDADERVVITYNGEIYNEAVLRHEIHKHLPVTFHSSCDAELIAPAYLCWQTAAFSRFEGMFAIGLWDAANSRAVLVRDPSGIKPLYYAWDGRTLRFASEIKGILADPSFRPHLDASSVRTFLAQGYPGPTRTLLHDVHAVPPGSIVIVDRHGLEIRRYWSPERTGEIDNIVEALDLFDGLWRQVVSDMLISDVPVGLLLSGGIDSALVASALKGSEVPTFTARFSRDSFNEASVAAAVAARFGMWNLAIDADSSADVERRFLDVVHHFDGNCADSSGFAFHSVCEAARKHVPVVLTGDGADEFFGGYETYRASRLARCIAPMFPDTIAQRAAGLLFSASRSGDDKVPASEKLARFMAGIANGSGTEHPQWRRYLFPEVAEKLYGPALRDVGSSDPLSDYAKAVESANGSLVDRCLIADQTYYLPGDLLVKSDAMSMAHGMEVRVPYLDRRIMEFSGRLHSDLLTPLLGPGKRVLRRALMKTEIQPEISRAPKQGFNIPVAHHLRNGLRPLGERLLERNAEVLSPLLDPGGITTIWREHAEQNANHGYVLWTLLTLAVWSERASIR